MADKIYSRKRIQIPKFRWNYPEKKNFVKVIVILTIAFTVLFSVNSSIEPIFKELAKNKAKEVATEILNIESSKVLKDGHYEDIIPHYHVLYDHRFCRKSIQYRTGSA